MQVPGNQPVNTVRDRAGSWVARPRCGCHAGLVAVGEPVRETGRRDVLLRRGRVLEGVTLGWNVAGIVVLAVAAVAARSVALAGFGLDSLIEIGARTVVLLELSWSGGAAGRSGSCVLRPAGGAGDLPGWPLKTGPAETARGTV